MLITILHKSTYKPTERKQQMSYETKNIRNICLLGHGNSGKTSLAESMLFTTGAIDRQGKVSDGNTVCDYDAEEIKRQVTISAAIAPISFGGKKINVIDCPGFQDFAGEVAAALRAVEAASSQTRSELPIQLSPLSLNAEYR